MYAWFMNWPVAPQSTRASCQSTIRQARFPRPSHPKPQHVIYKPQTHNLLHVHSARFSTTHYPTPFTSSHSSLLASYRFGTLRFTYRHVCPLIIFHLILVTFLQSGFHSLFPCHG